MTLFKSNDEKNEIDQDDDDQKQLNKWKNTKKVKLKTSIKIETIFFFKTIKIIF